MSPTTEKDETAHHVGHKDDVESSPERQHHRIDIDPEIERRSVFEARSVILTWTDRLHRLVRKIDLRLLPFTALIYLLCYLDRSNIGKPLD